MADGFIADPSITMLYATDGIGKSLIGVQMAMELASGLPVFKTLHIESPQKVIYVVAERSIKEPVKRIKRMFNDPDYAGRIKLENLSITTEFQGRDISNASNFEDLLSVLRRHAENMHGCDMVVFDPLYALVKGDLKEDKAINAVFSFFRAASALLNANIFFFHHENRGQRLEGAEERTGQDFYGNKFISGLCTAVWHMKREDKRDQFKTALLNEKDTEGALIPKITLIYDPDFNTVQADVSSSTKAKDLSVTAFLYEAKKARRLFTSEQFFAETHISIHKVSERRMIAKLVKDGRIKNTAENGLKGIYQSL